MLQSHTGKSTSITNSVGSSKLVRKYLLTSDRHRLLKSGPIRLTSPSPPHRRLGFDGTYQTPSKLLLRSTNASRRQSFLQPTTTEEPQITRNVTEEDDGEALIENNSKRVDCSPSTTSSTPGSLDEEGAVGHTLFRHVQEREECINPVSRILWETAVDEEELPTATEEFSFVEFRVVSPLSQDVTTSTTASSTLLARPMAVRPMLLV